MREAWGARAKNPVRTNSSRCYRVEMWTLRGDRKGEGVTFGDRESTHRFSKLSWSIVLVGYSAGRLLASSSYVVPRSCRKTDRWIVLFDLLGKIWLNVIDPSTLFLDQSKIRNSKISEPGAVLASCSVLGISRSKFVIARQNFLIDGQWNGFFLAVYYSELLFCSSVLPKMSSLMGNVARQKSRNPFRRPFVRLAATAQKLPLANNVSWLGANLTFRSRRAEDERSQWFKSQISKSITQTKSSCVFFFKVAFLEGILEDDLFPGNLSSFCPINLRLTWRKLTFRTRRSEAGRSPCRSQEGRLRRRGRYLAGWRFLQRRRKGQVAALTSS